MESDQNLAFLDTLSCGLGALMLLFFIFSAVSDEGNPGPAVMPVLTRSEIQLPNATEAGEDQALIPVIYSISFSAACTLANPDAQTQPDFGETSDGDYDVFGIAWNQADDIEIEIAACEESGPVTATLALLDDTGRSVCAPLPLPVDPAQPEMIITFNASGIFLNGRQTTEAQDSVC